MGVSPGQGLNALTAGAVQGYNPAAIAAVPAYVFTTSFVDARDSASQAFWTAHAAGDVAAQQAALAAYANANGGDPGVLALATINAPAAPQPAPAPATAYPTQAPAAPAGSGSTRPSGSGSGSTTAAAAPRTAYTAGAVATVRSQQQGQRVGRNFLGAALAPIAATGPVGLVIGIGVALASVLGGLFGGLFGGGANYGKMIDAVRTSLVEGFNETVQYMARLARAIGKILDLLHDLLNAVVHGIIDVLRALAKLLGEAWEKVLKPALKAIHDIRARLLRIYERIIRPALIVIQRVRQVLAILKLFHLKFAEKLDAELARLEYKLTQPLFYLLKYVNGVANLINLIMTAGMIMQKPFFLASLDAYKGSASNLLINSWNAGNDQSAIDRAQAAGQIPPVQQTSADFREWATIRAGAFAATSSAADREYYQKVTQGA